MALCLLHILEFVLLLLNAAAILNAERFLRKLRLHSVSAAAAASAAASPGGAAAAEGGWRMQIALLLFSIRTYLRGPLVAANLVVIVIELLFG